MRVLVCCLGGLGDAVAILPTLDALNDGLDDPEITVLCPPRLAGLLTTSIPGVRPVPVPEESLRGMGARLRIPVIAKQIGAVDVALMAPFQGHGALALARRCGAHIISFACEPPREQKLAQTVLPYDPLRPVPDLLCDFARLLLDWPDMRIQRVAPVMGPMMMGFAGLEDDEFDVFSEPYGVIHSGAGSALQQWGVERFQELAKALTDCYGFSWRLVSEDDYDLVDLAALLAEARGFVGCHSGPLQLAAAQGVPWVAVAGPTSVAWDPPWQDVPGVVVRRGLACQPCAHEGVPLLHCQSNGACLDAISVAEVVSAVQRVVASSPAASVAARSI